MSSPSDPNQGTPPGRTIMSYFTPSRKRPSKPQTTTPNSEPPEGAGRAPDGTLLAGRVQPLQAPDSLLAPRVPAQKRKPVPDDGDDDHDHDMLGKDIPTIFKRPRSRRDAPLSDTEEVSFAAAYPRFLMLDAFQGAFPALTLGGGPQTFSIGNLPIYQSGFIEAPGSSQDAGKQDNSSAGPSRAKTTTNASRARRTPSRRTSRAPEPSDDSGEQSEPVVDDETGMGLALAALRRGKSGARPTKKRVRLSQQPQSSGPQSPFQRTTAEEETSDQRPARSSADKEEAPALSERSTPHEESDGDAMATDTPQTTPSADKGKGRAESGASFVTRAELGDIQYSLRKLNNNVGRLVLLMGEQTQFFSTMQARGWRESSPTNPSQHAAADSHGDANVHAAAEKLRRRAAHDPKPTELPTSRDPDDNALKARIRKAARQLMGRQTSKDPFYADYMASDTEAENYDPEQGPACTVEDFRPDLSGTPANAWNASVVQTFVAHFMKMEPAADEDKVAELFETHLKYLCNRYKESLQGEAAARRRQKLANRAERQRNLWVRRLTAAAFHADLVRHIPILRALGLFGMSSDESDHEAGGEIRYRILRKPWRNPDLTLWLRLFDKLYSIWRLGNLQGSQPHPRHPSNVVSIRRPPVRGLPWNAYNKAWFEKLTDYDKTLLAPKMDEAYDFSHPITLRNQAAF